MMIDYYRFLDKIPLYCHHILRRIINTSFTYRLITAVRKNRLGIVVSTFDTDPVYPSCLISNSDELTKGIHTIFKTRIEFDNGIVWDTDLFSGYSWPSGTYYRDYKQIDLWNNADVKIPRELSRCHHLLLYGMAFKQSKQKKYYDAFKNDVESWLIQNPLLRSINWGCTQDVAIRAINWVMTSRYFIKNLDSDKAFKKKLLGSLYNHGIYIYFNPEKNSYNNHNHYLSDLVGLLYIGHLFMKNDKFAKTWFYWGVKELFREIRYQVLPTGPSYERSINYHRFVTELVLSSIALLTSIKHEIPIDIWQRVQAMVEFVMYYTKPDGTSPIIGDQDDARVHPFGDWGNLDHRFLLSHGALLFGRPDFKHHAGDIHIDTVHLFGSGAVAEYGNLASINRDLKSRSFPDAGFFIIREHDDYMFINNSGKSKNAELGGGTHTHSDLLSFELYVGDKTFIVDPGTYVYSSNPDERMMFRSTHMHNTIVVDKQSQNTLNRDSLWDFGRDAIPSTLMWRDDDNQVEFEGEHNGYTRLDYPIIHRRRIKYDKKERTWRITDMLIGTGTHSIELYLHFDKGIDLSYADNTLSTMCATGVNIDINFDAKQHLRGAIQDGWVSKSYSKRDHAKVFRLSGEVDCPMEITTVINRRCT